MFYWYNKNTSLYTHPVILIFLLVFILAQPSSSQGKSLPIIFATFPPMNYLDDQGEMRGISFELVTQTVKAIGYTPEVTILPWKRAYKEAAEGSFAILFTFTQNEERIKQFLFTDYLIKIADVFFKRKENNITWNKLSDLKKYVVGYTDGYNYDPIFLNAITNKSFIARKSPALESPEKQHLKNLFHKRVDLIICEIHQCKFYLGQNKDWQQVIDSIPKPIGKTRTFHAGISRAWPNAEELLKQFNSQYRKIKKSGLRKKIVLKYIDEELE
ncbi:substrate-binding periplasmic protein [Zooshikella harenae]|uniref:Transporter substrate-binding domain-containing protein n=1 Tax=Zooshikella harenae TaxID=2827238 RepID=A0ABS5ZH74_9GAMM|nr:transporter substrate-binding domain-containing protein [Zooshikella harenae]MBU2713406.1 transporter substrate-binding domain-containing protein [Zooshikella harenae]